MCTLRSSQHQWLIASLMSAALTSAVSAQLVAPSPFTAGAGETVAEATTLSFDVAAYESLMQTEQVVVRAFPIGPHRNVDLALRRFDVIAPNAEIVVQDAHSARRLPRPDLTTFTGHVVGDPASRVFLAVSPHGTHGFLEMEHETHIISSGPRSASLNTLIYPLAGMPSDLINSAGFHCDSVDQDGAPLQGPLHAAKSPGPARAHPVVQSSGSPVRTFDMALETDFEYTSQVFSGDTEAAAAYAATLLAAVSSICEREMNVRFELVFLRLWETGRSVERRRRGRADLSVPRCVGSADDARRSAPGPFARRPRSRWRRGIPPRRVR
jgi:hypothetical protein